MCLSATFIVTLAFMKTYAIAEEHGDHFNTAYAPSTVNFNEIFTNSLSLNEEPILTTVTKDEDFHLHLPSQFVEFRPQKQETTTTPTPPPPMYLLNSSYLKKENETDSDNSHNVTTTTAVPRLQKPANVSMTVIPIEKRKYQRGVLDLLFPASRVRAFKGVFDTFRRILSHTFRKR